MPPETQSRTGFDTFKDGKGIVDVAMTCETKDLNFDGSCRSLNATPAHGMASIEYSIVNRSLAIYGTLWLNVPIMSSQRLYCVLH